MRPSLATLFLAVPAVALLPAAAAAADVRWDFSKGDTHTYRFVQNAKADITQFGQTAASTTDLDVTQKWDVKEVNADGSAVVNRTVDRIVIKTAGGGGPAVSYDSAAADAVDPATLPAQLRVLASLAGQTFPSVIAPDGTVKNVTVPEAVKRAAAAAGPGGAFGEEQVKLLFTDRGYTLPPEGTAVGGTWTSRAELPLSFGAVTDDRTMTLTAADGGTATIDLKSALAGSGEAGGPMTVESGTQTGTVRFDTKDGRLASADTEQTIALAGPGGFKVVLNSESSLKRTGD